MSPQASDFGGDTVSPITSPPATPQFQDSEMQQNIDSRQSSFSNVLRRRTISTTLKLGKDEPTLCMHSEDENEVLLAQFC